MPAWLRSRSCGAGKKKLKQTEPPSIPLTRLFPDGIYPEGEWQSYKDECVPFLMSAIHERNEAKLAPGKVSCMRGVCGVLSASSGILACCPSCRPGLATDAA